MTLAPLKELPAVSLLEEALLSHTLRCEFGMTEWLLMPLPRNPLPWLRLPLGETFAKSG